MFTYASQLLFLPTACRRKHSDERQLELAAVVYWGEQTELNWTELAVSKIKLKKNLKRPKKKSRRARVLKQASLRMKSCSTKEPYQSVLLSSIYHIFAQYIFVFSTKRQRYYADVGDDLLQTTLSWQREMSELVASVIKLGNIIPVIKQNMEINLFALSVVSITRSFNLKFGIRTFNIFLSFVSSC